VITLAGVELVIPDKRRKLARWLEQYLPLMDLRDQCGPVALNSQRTQSRSGFKSGVGLPLPNYPDPPAPKINTLYWPTGASRWARGYFLATSTQLEQILEEVGESNAAIELVLEDEDRGKSITVDVHLLPPRPLTAGSAEDGLVNLYLLPVVDKRYYWQFKHTDNLEIDHESDWDFVFSTLGTRLGSEITVDPFVGDYKVPDTDELTRRYENAAVMLDAAAHSTGRRIVVEFDGTVLALGFNGSLTRLEGNLEEYALLAGGKIDFNLAAITPEKVLVTFPKYYDHYPDCNGELFTVEVPPEDEEAVVTSGAIKVIHSTAYADYTTHGGTPDNESDLQALAEVIAADFYASLAEYFDRSFLSLCEWQPTAFDDYTEFSFGSQAGDYDCDDENEQLDEDGPALPWQAHTRVHGRPYNFGVEEQLQQFEDLTVIESHQIGKTAGAIGKGADGNVDVYRGTAGSETPTSPPITVKAFNKFADVESGVDVGFIRVNNFWYLIASECAPEA
jgi:hypothetical protein